MEGLDGAGKNTLVSGLIDRWSAAGLRVATFTFPRYGRSATADIAAEALHGSHGDLRDSVYAMALLFALDRAGAVEDIHAATEAHDIVILDRYVASNAAYNAARLQQGAGGESAAGGAVAGHGSHLVMGSGPPAVADGPPGWWGQTRSVSMTGPRGVSPFGGLWPLGGLGSFGGFGSLLASGHTMITAGRGCVLPV